MKLIDFGLAAYYKNQQEDSIELSTQVGTILYLAPEVFERKYSKECDMWSLGVLTFMLLVLSSPFNAETEAAL